MGRPASASAVTAAMILRPSTSGRKSPSRKTGARRVYQRRWRCGRSLQLLHRGDAAAHDGYAEPGELGRRDVVAGVELSAPEVVLPGVAGKDGCGPRPGGVDDHARPPAPGVGVHEEVPVRFGVRARDGGDDDRAQHRQRPFPLERGEVAGDGGAARLVRVDRRHREGGQVEDAVDRRHPQRLPPVLPGPAGRGVGVQHDEGAAGPGLGQRAGETPALEVVGGRQPGLPAPDHDDRRGPLAGGVHGHGSIVSGRSRLSRHAPAPTAAGPGVRASAGGARGPGRRRSRPRRPRRAAG